MRQTAKICSGRKLIFKRAISIENALRPPYIKATIGNMLPATFFSNVAGHY
jgi:hypothetical protein